MNDKKKIQSFNNNKKYIVKIKRGRNADNPESHIEINTADI